MNHIRFLVVVSPDKTTIALITPAMIGTAPITQALERARGSRPCEVVQGQWGVFPEDDGRLTTYRFGTCGALHYAEPQPDEVLEALRDAVAAEILAAGYGLLEE